MSRKSNDEDLSDIFDDLMNTSKVTNRGGTYNSRSKKSTSLCSSTRNDSSTIYSNHGAILPN